MLSLTDVFNRLKEVYPQLAPIKLKQIGSTNGKRYHGMAKLNFEDKEFTTDGKSRWKDIAPSCIQLDFSLKDALYVLLHEVAHCLVPYYERKVKGEWVRIEHDRAFYAKLLEVIEQANKLDLYHKKFDGINHLMRYD